MILLSFDIEEFDTPNLHYKKELPWAEQLRISKQGAEIILNLLKKHGVQATFFCTAKMAQSYPELIKQMVQEGHEIASHTFSHSSFHEEDLLTSKKILKEISGQEILGIRFPNMQGVSSDKIVQAGYQYDSSLNPCFIPGRYAHFRAKRTLFKENNLWEVPASVSPWLRIPLFWLSFHNFPMFFYQYLVERCLKKDAYVNIYFHPWEFVDLHNKEYGLPFIIRNNSGKKMEARLEKFIVRMKRKNRNFSSVGLYVLGEKKA